LRIASFNLENLSDHPRSGLSSAERHAVLRPQLIRLEADVLCLQEVDGSHAAGEPKRSLAALEALLEGTPYQAFHCATTTSPKSEAPRDRHNVVTLSRWPIQHETQYSNVLVPPLHHRVLTGEPPEDESAISWDRPILETAIALPDGSLLHVINMHLKAPVASAIPGQKLGPQLWKTVPGWAEGYFLASIKRSGQALEARMVVDRIFDRNANALIAVCGDFNAEEREVPTRILIGDTEDTGNGALTGRELVALEHDVPDFRRFTVLHAGRKLMLDHILVSRPLLARYERIEVHNEALGDEVVAYLMVPNTPESYHAPVVAAFNDGLE